jgi:methyl-accepting chemotaxis protein
VKKLFTRKNKTKADSKRRKSWFKLNMSIRTKLISGFVVIIALLIATSALSYFGFNSLSTSIQAQQYTSLINSYWSTLHSTMSKEADAYTLYLATKNQSDLGTAKTLTSQIDSTVSMLKIADNAENVAALESILAGHQAWLEMINSLQSAVDSGQDYTDLKKECNFKSLVLLGQVRTQLTTSQGVADAAVKESESSVKLYTLILLIVSGAAIIIAALFAFFLSRSISRGINQVNRALKKMAGGDLTEKVDVISNDEIGAMVKSYNEMQGYLNKLVAQLKSSSSQLSAASAQLAAAANQSSQSTQQVANSSQQMAKGAQEQSINAQGTSKSIEKLNEIINQLSRGAQEQSACVQQAVSSITSVSETISRVATSADLAAKGSKQAADSAIIGAEKSKKTLSGMDKIKTSTSKVAQKIEELGTRSSEIGKIVAVIDDIAAQTNLLALNAAIEAARAGDQGRGFAVVSDEVRKLAERTAAATKEIADLISSVQKGVNETIKLTAGNTEAVLEGYTMAVQAGESLEQILKASNDVNTRIDEISAKAQQVNVAANDLVKVIDNVGNISEQNSTATKQMTASAGEVSKSIETVAGIAEENSAATEEVSASAEEMSAQVEEIVASSQTLKDMASILEQSITIFKVDEEKTEDSAPAASDTVQNS